MKLILLLLLFAKAEAYETPVFELQVVTVELNHVYDKEANHMFGQVILYHYVNDYYYEIAEATTLFRQDYNAGHNFKYDRFGPFKDSKGTYVKYRRYGVLTKVYCDAFKETWTQHDVEFLDRENLPTYKRIPQPRPKQYPKLLHTNPINIIDNAWHQDAFIKLGLD